MTSRTFCIFDISARKAVRVAALAASTTLLAVGQAASAQSAQSPQGAESILQIILNADAVVKAVMLLLVAASILSWALWFIKRKELRSAKIALKDDIRILIGAPRLAIAKVSYPATAQMIEIAASELERSGDRPTHRTLEGVEDRVGAQLPIVEARAIHQIQWGGNILASIGSISPFVGLAGTVWGIVHSFLGIAQSQSTSLAVVAPGIAEALIATAMGLAAAIPAVLIYNALTRSVAGYRRLLSEVAVLTACILSREIERKDSPQEERHPGIAQRGEPVIALVQNAEAER